MDWLYVLIGGIGIGVFIGIACSCFTFALLDSISERKEKRNAQNRTY